MADPTRKSAVSEALARAYNRGLELEKAGDIDGAADAYGEALRLDPDDMGGASVRLAAIGRGPAPVAAPPAYVATLFDQNAAEFDDILVEQLGYAVPMLVREKIGELGLGPWPRMLDLGCGTGLTGASMADLAGDITGVDLAEAMLDEAHERDCYDTLYVAEAVEFLAETDEEPWDLITATDVLPYIGALEPFFAALDRALLVGGVLIVSSETIPDDPTPWQVGAKHRYAHAQDYLVGLVADHGMQVLEASPITVRYDEGAAVPGHLLIARRGG